MMFQKNMTAKAKLSIIGAGNVGAQAAQLAAQSGICDVVLYDIAEGMPQGKALDIQEACPLWGSSSKVTGSNSLADTAGSDIAVITAGLARKPGMSRDDLLKTNAQIVGGLAAELAKLSPHAIFIVVTNPVDAMTQLSWKKSGFPSNRVFGMGGVLDSARLRAFIAMETGVAPKDIEAQVLGGHGDQMVPVEALINVKGIPLSKLLPGEKIKSLIERTRNGGAEIVSLLKTGSAYYAPAMSVFEMVKSVLLDEKRVLPCAAYLEGQYKNSGVYAGVPVVLGRGGVERIIEAPLSAAEAEGFSKSAEAVKALCGKLGI